MDSRDDIYLYKILSRPTLPNSWMSFRKKDRDSLILSSPTNFRKGLHLTDGELQHGERGLAEYAKTLARKEEDKPLISGPLRVKHKLHVDANMNWTDTESLQLQKKIGEGAYGAVYKALHLPTNTKMAVKRVPNVDSADSSGITKEMEILKQCRHDNIVSLYGCSFSDDCLMIIMDYCGAGSIKDIMKNTARPFTEQEISAILYLVLQGLSYLHSISVVHRDLKSANILITEDGVAKIADFGVSFQVNSTLAKMNTVVGTPLFMAPEALDKGDYTNRSDIWSLGITAIEMFDESPPHQDEHIMRAMLLITRSEPPKLKSPEKASYEFNSFIARCLRKDPNERPSAKELIEDPFFKHIDHKAVLETMVTNYKIFTRERKKAEEKRQQEIQALRESVFPEKSGAIPKRQSPRSFHKPQSMDLRKFQSPSRQELKRHWGIEQKKKDAEAAEQLANGAEDYEGIQGVSWTGDALAQSREVTEYFLAHVDVYQEMSYSEIVRQIHEMENLLSETMKE